MFANITPFKTAEAERRTARFKVAADHLYATLTERFEANSDAIKTKLQEAIRDAKTRRDYRVPVCFYNSVRWARTYAEAKEELGDEFETNRRRLRWEIDERELETCVELDGNRVPVHRIMLSFRFLNRLGAFFGDHFTVTLQARKVNAITKDYTAVEQTVYLNYWPEPLPPTVLGLREPLSPIPVESSTPFFRLEGDTLVCYCQEGEA